MGLIPAELDTTVDSVTKGDMNPVTSNAVNVTLGDLLKMSTGIKDTGIVVDSSSHTYKIAGLYDSGISLPPNGSWVLLGNIGLNTFPLEIKGIFRDKTNATTMARFFNDGYHFHIRVDTNTGDVYVCQDGYSTSTISVWCYVEIGFYVSA